MNWAVGSLIRKFVALDLIAVSLAGGAGGCPAATYFLLAIVQKKVSKEKATRSLRGFWGQGLLGSDTNFAAVQSTAPEGRAKGSANLGSDPKNPLQRNWCLTPITLRCGASPKWGQSQTRLAPQTRACPDPLCPALLASAKTVGERNTEPDAGAALTPALSQRERE